MPNENEKDLERILNKTLRLNLTTLKEGSRKYLQMGDKGLEIFREYHNYLAYAKKEKKKARRKERAETVDRNFRNWNIVFTLMLADATTIISLLPSKETEEQTQLKQEVKRLSGQLDSLIHSAKP